MRQQSIEQQQQSGSAKRSLSVSSVSETDGHPLKKKPERGIYQPPSGKYSSTNNSNNKNGGAGGAGGRFNRRTASTGLGNGASGGGGGGGGVNRNGNGRRFL